MEDKNIVELLEKVGVKLEKQTNAVTYTDGSGAGQELIPVNVLMQEAIDYSVENGSLLPFLPGFHGRSMPETVKVQVVGDAPLFEVGSEWASGSIKDQIATGNALSTADVTITQKKYRYVIDISDEELKFAPIDLQNIVRTKLRQGADRTMTAVILNGDTETGATGNVNSDDGAPASTSYYLQGDGLRKTVIVTDTNSSDLGTLAWADFSTLLNVLGNLGADPADLLWLFNSLTYNKASDLEEFVNAARNGRGSTINERAITNIKGSDVIKLRDLGLTEADGKISTTPANNTKGQLGLIHRAAVQYGFNGDLAIEPFRVPGQGIQLYAWFYMGFSIWNPSFVTGDKTAAWGINITV